MKKTCVFLAGIVLVILLAFACEFPSSIEFKTDNYQANAPVKIGRFNPATVMSEAFKGSFPEDFNIYDMVDYEGSLAFLVAYPMDLLESFNPDDYLKDIQKQMDTMKDFASNGVVYPEPINIPQIASGSPTITVFDLSMKKFFLDVQNKINANSTNEEDFDSPLSSSVYLDVFTGHDFDSITVDAGSIVLDIWLETTPPIAMAPSFEVVGNIVLNSTPSVSRPMTVSSSYTSVDFNLNGNVVTNTAQFQLSSITVTNPGGIVSGYTLHMKPRLQDITLRGATNLRVGRSEEDVPSAIINNLELEFDDALINALIKEGDFNLTAEHNTVSTPRMDIGYRIRINQEAADPVYYPGNNISFPNERFNYELFTKDDHSLDGKWISGKKLKVDESVSKIIISANSGGSSFNLSGTPGSGDMRLPVKMDNGIKINVLEIVRWKTVKTNGDRILPEIIVPPINFAGENGEEPFIKTIIFSQMQLNVDFVVPDPSPPPLYGPVPLPVGPKGLPAQLKGNLALQVSCPRLGFHNNNYPNNPRPLVTEVNPFTAVPTKLTIDPLDPTVTIHADLLPIVLGKIRPADFPCMEFGSAANPIDITNNDFIMDIYSEVFIVDKWQEAEIDMQAVMRRSDNDEPEGTLPDKGEDAINLSEFNKYMHGIIFDGGVQAKLFMGGPNKLIEKLKPKLNFSAQWEDENLVLQEEHMLRGVDMKVGDKLPKMPEKNPKGEYVYYGVDLPLPGQGHVLTGSFNRIITSFPSYLYFRYAMIFPGADNPLTVYPDTFDDVEEDDDSKMKGLLVMLMPMEFIAEPGGYFAIPSDVFGGSDNGKDFFGRTNPQDKSLFTGIHIKSLGMRMDFDGSLFKGSYLHFDRDDLLFGPDGISAGNENGLRITFTGEQQRIIDENLIYPDIKFVYPRGEKFNIGKYSLPLRIVVSASGSITVDLDDLLGSGN